MKETPITTAEKLKAKIGLGNTGWSRIAGPPPTVPDHEMIRCIGQGSYGEVWLARNAVGTWRAVKVVYRQNFKDSRPYEREFAGIQSYEPISRSNEGLIDVLQIGRNDAEAYFYYVMELADPADSTGRSDEPGPNSPQSKEKHTAERSAIRFDPNTYVPKTLSRVIAQQGRLGYDQCITLGLTLNLALGHLHKHRLIHRDVKPSNIVFVNGVPKLTDIGLVADLSGAQSFVGTEGFIPPEGPNSPQADLYALGKVLYEASMGKDRNEFPEPFTALGLDAESKALMELNAVLLRACASSPKERYQRAEEMNADLALLHNGESVRNKHALQRRLKRMRQMGGAVLAFIVIGIVSYYFRVKEAERATEAARRETELRKQAQTEGMKRQEVAQFLKDMLKAVEPSVALGRDTTMLREIVDQTAERIGKDLNKQPEVEAELRNTLGNVYLELGDFKTAETNLRRALELRLGPGASDDLALAQTMSDLSPALWKQGKLAEAEIQQRRALEMRQKLAGMNDLLVAESYQDLGCIVSAQAKMSEAEQYFRQALDIRRKELGPEDIQVAQSLSGVANMLNAEGQWVSAESLFREMLAINRKKLGERDPRTAAALNGLVLALLPQDKLEEAEADAREGLAIQKALLGPDHPVVAQSLTRLARVLQRVDKLSEAKEDLEQALAIWSQRFSNQTPGIGETLSALFDILLSQGNHNEAERILKQVLTPEALGERPNLSLLLACGRYRARTGQWGAAAENFSKIIELAPGYHEAYHALSALYLQAGNTEGYRRIREQIRAEFGSITNDPSIADRMAKDCMILPDDPANMGVEARLANVTVTFDETSANSPWFQFCKGLSEYRQGHYQQSQDWIRKVLLKASEGSTRDVEAYMILAMDEQQLGEHERAKETLAQGARLGRRRLNELASGDIGEGWIDWIFAHTLMSEASNVVQQAAAPLPQ